MKYTDTQITFREVPDEISLCINISNCPIHCPDCHSKELWKDVGTELTTDELERLIQENNGISCVCFMGGDSDILEVRKLIYAIRNKYDKLAVAWYSGQDEMHPVMLAELDYYKYGSYKKEFGGLDKKTTNQHLFKVNRNNGTVEDITYKFWQNDSNNCS